MKLIFPLAALMVAAVAMAAFANAGDKSSPRSVKSGHYFEKMDMNSDGIVSRNEFNNHYTRTFDEIDANRDKTLTQAELARYQDSKRLQQRSDMRSGADMTMRERASMGMNDDMDMNDMRPSAGNRTVDDNDFVGTTARNRSFDEDRSVMDRGAGDTIAERGRY